MSYKHPENKSIQEIEQEILQFWKDNKVFEKSVEQRSQEDLYVFYDGPPFISGLPHYGHLVVSIAKDLIPRYWTMKGKRVERIWGWDAHGLTVENKVQKELGIKNRRDIESYGLEKFTESCYNYTSKTSSEWNWYIDKIGRWVDMEHAYKTIDRDYMESVMWAFKQLYDKGHIYEGVRTSLYCTTCGTPVSNFEVAMDNTYKDVEDPAVSVKFKITTKGAYENVYVLAWTTTPWTLPSNRALVINKNESYSLVTSNGEKFIVGTKRIESVFMEGSYNVELEISTEDLLGLSYEPLYTFYSYGDKEFKIYHFDGMVNMEEGTGIVHSAPGFGMVDTEMGVHYGLGVMLKIDGEGKFISGDNGSNPFEGMFYKKADKYITKDLIERNLLFKEESIKHRFPYHDRCDTLLIQRAQNSWFVGVNKLKQNLYKNNEAINWIPDHLKNGRFEKGIEQAPDWAISRSRFWATPMPVWRSEQGDTLVVGSIEEIERLSGQKVKDLHRPYIDEIVLKKDGIEYKRIPDVLDSWFEAGSMPYAQIHYPFENKDKFEKNFPGDFIVEYIAQTRAWFYVLHVLSTALFETNSFKNVISYGVLAGNDGRKMSKTYGNYTDPREVLEKIGGDALRLYFMSSSIMMGENVNIDDEEIKTKLKSVLNPLLNSAKFFLIYASQYNWKPGGAWKSANVLDKWIMVRTHSLIKNFSENIEKYQIPAAVAPIDKYVDDLSRWYVRRSRDRISAGDAEALHTLYEVLSLVSKALAPIIPFISEYIYSSVVVAVDAGASKSVHLCDFPTYDSALIKEGDSLLENMESDRVLVSSVLALRTQNNLAVRQPLQSLYTTMIPHFHDIIRDEVNVKEIYQVESIEKYSENPELVCDESKSFALNIKIDADLKLEGNVRELIRKFQDLRKRNNLNQSDIREFTYEKSPLNDETIKKFGLEIMQKVQASNLVPAEDFAIKEL